MPSDPKKKITQGYKSPPYLQAEKVEKNILLPPSSMVLRVFSISPSKITSKDFFYHQELPWWQKRHDLMLNKLYVMLSCYYKDGPSIFHNQH